ncbi:transcriptional regulator with XRE-family HTH domain [Actinoalloteichus hoggarensis]|uniref:Helix-turn-helix protein n=1 Tax=Actinoalloteichus hoggarensis TaxID=1470176 RepID=A0A221W9B8_9PSEU|nr:helix-turn-helix transcriptional regulator [Actinoalloteichus hoggarensis]ASO22261.1 helix-turn-helix protein [Actinoalloteichus hoggarensis]MBB5923319.1 transcriptional regulator with XRE-family HTH domain [Actinoalloteichus hoggarensis]
MSIRDEVREFVVSRRANVTPEQAGLPDLGGDRRVPGLRREEVAMLAGVSLDYYTRLERGDIHRASESVLNAIARALQLDEVEREYLFDLARIAPSGHRAGQPVVRSVRSSVQRVLDNLTVPAIVHNASQDLIAANPLGRALYAPHFDVEGVPNTARFVFLDPRAEAYYLDWPQARRTTAAVMRRDTGRDPHNAELSALITELSARSPHFRRDWADHDVHSHRTGVKSFRHPEIGRIDVTFDVFEQAGEPGLQIVTYGVGPSAEAARSFARLREWAAARRDERPPAAADPATSAGGGFRRVRTAPVRRQPASQ